MESPTLTSAFESFYEQHAVGVAIFFARRTFDVEAARDLTAETFAQAFEGRARFRGSSDDEAAAWLYGIARHQLSHYVRRGVAGRRAVERLRIEVPELTPDDHERIIELAGFADVRERVRDALQDLSPDQRTALQLRVVDDRPYAEVATRLGVSEGTARARVSRALRKLAAAIEPIEALEVES